MTRFEEAFHKILETKDVQQVANCDYLYEIEGETKLFTEEEIIEYANRL